MKLTITLEWFLNPDHLPFIVGVETGEYKRARLDVTIVEPRDHYDGFADLEKQKIDIHINEPIHLFEHFNPYLRSLGCFFETDGGILMRSSSVTRLKQQKKIRICTPAAEDITNRIGFEILLRYAKQNGFVIERDNIEFVQASFHHIDNMRNDETLDGAWLCFYNFEGVEAEQAGMDFIFIDQHQSPYPNFSALEMITTDAIYANKGEAIDKFVAVTHDMIELCKNDASSARKYYYSYCNLESDALMDAIIDNTLTRFYSPIEHGSHKWQSLRTMLSEIGIVTLSDEQYEQLWSL